MHTLFNGKPQAPARAGRGSYQDAQAPFDVALFPNHEVVTQPLPVAVATGIPPGKHEGPEGRYNLNCVAAFGAFGSRVFKPVAKATGRGFAGPEKRNIKTRMRVGGVSHAGTR